jgi:hypothetical protein
MAAWPPSRPAARWRCLPLSEPSELINRITAALVFFRQGGHHLKSRAQATTIVITAADAGQPANRLFGYSLHRFFRSMNRGTPNRVTE